MKKYFALILVVFVAFGCKKKKDDGGGSGQGTPSVYVGNWVIDEIEFAGSANVAGQTLPFTGEGANYQGGYNLMADKTMSYNTKYDLVIDLPLLGQQTVPVDVKGSGTWKVESNKLILMETGRTQEFPIKVATSNIMILEQDTTIAQAGINAKLNMEITLRK